jgi:hypothetical protein
MWIVVVGLLLLAAILTTAYPVYRRHRAITEIEKVGGQVRTRPANHPWLRRCVGDRWMRGFETVDTVEFLGSKSLKNTDLAWLLELPEIQTLTFGFPMVDERGVRPFSHTVYRRGSSIQHPEITDEGMRYVKALKHLDWLSLSETQVGDAGLEQLSGRTELRFLCLDMTRVTDTGLVHLRRMKNLRGLSLYRTAVSDAGISELKCLPLLTHLYFHRVGDPTNFDTWRNEDMLKGELGILKKSIPHLQVHYGPGGDDF